MQTLPDTNGRTFFKWKSVGDTVDIVVTEAPVFDKPNQFGSKDSYLLGQNAEGETLQVPLPVNAKGKVQGIADLIIPGKTRFVLKFTGTVPIKGKAQPVDVFAFGS